jgi:bacterioferritin
MHGNEKVIAQLNAALSGELTAIVQYMTQSEMCQNWGYKRLADLTKVRAIEEMKHAEGLIEHYLLGQYTHCRCRIEASTWEQGAAANRD